MVHPLITLYSPTETEFTTNGLGSLGEATSCTVVEEANGSFELELVYPVHGRRYNDLVNRAIIFAKPNPVDRAQPFRIYEISRPINGLVTFYAAHISYDLSGYPVKPFTAGSAAGAFSGLKSNAVSPHPFTFWTDKNVTSDFSVEAPSSTRSMLAGVRGSILDVYGGEYKFDRFTVMLYVHRGSDRGVVIRYGKNLTDLQQEENVSKVYTAVLPYWKSYEDGSLVQLSEATVPTGGTYNFTNIYTLDLSSEFEEAPTEEELRTRAKRYITDNELGSPTVSLKISFAQLEQTEEYKHLTLLERVELFDTVSVEFPEMNVSSTAKVNQTVYNVLTGRYDSVTLGEVRANLSDTIITQDSNVKQVENNARSELRRSVDRATNWITNGKGYMVAVKDEAGTWIEICSLDTPDIDKAVNVWRWNNGGFGFSSHGYNGPYETAITQDGEIVANFITTGTLTATLIRAGILQDVGGNVFYLDLEAGILRMNATEFTVKGVGVDEMATEISRSVVNSARAGILQDATGIASDLAAAAVKAQTQKDIFDKLTNNGESPGIYLSNGKLYINANYVVTGILTDRKGNNIWDLDDGTLITKNIMAYGAFQCGSSTATIYTILTTDGKLAGYRNNRQVGYINYSASTRYIPTGETLYGIQMQAEGIIRMSSPIIAVAESSDVQVTATTGTTTRIEPRVVYNISDNGNGTISWNTGSLVFDFINGICTMATSSY